MQAEREQNAEMDGGEKEKWLEAFRRRPEERHIKVVLLGDEMVGKASIVNQYVNREFSMWFNPDHADFLTERVSMDDRILNMQVIPFPFFCVMVLLLNSGSNLALGHSWSVIIRVLAPCGLVCAGL